MEGIVTGGVVTLAGAAYGGREKDDSVIVLKINHGSANVELYFKDKDVQKKFGQLASLFK